jgi:Fe2+ or Zn2+ uptake regulation protein
VDAEQAASCLRAAGRRITPERIAVLDAMAAHPHADARELYRLARDRCPRISLSTVYRTVNLLRGLGMAEASGLGEGHRHFETRSESHYHCVCAGCGRVIELAPIEAVRQRALRLGFDVLSESVELVGYCASCSARRRDAPDRVSSVVAFTLPGDGGEDAMRRLEQALAGVAPGGTLSVAARGAAAESAIADAVRRVPGVRLERFERHEDSVVATLIRFAEAGERER